MTRAAPTSEAASEAPGRFTLRPCGGACAESAIIATAHGPRFDFSALPRTLMEALLAARRAHGGARIILEGHDGETMSYDGLLTAAHALAGRLAKITARGDRIGVMLPTSIAATAALFASQLARLTPAMINYSASRQTVQAACELANIAAVITSRRFIREARLDELAAALAVDRRVVELEDLVNQLTPLHKLSAYIQTHAPHLAAAARQPEKTAVILFTSGTTGAPKGVALSHANLIANVEQCRWHTTFDPDWVFFNTLPVFHALGLTGGVLLPILTGLKSVLYPSPLHHERIPALVRRTRANVLLSTDTFASHYARTAHAGALASLRYVVLGAERVREETRQAYARACDAVMLEGYGATECSPIIAVNQPEANRPGTVGKLLPGIEARLIREAGVSEGGRLLVRGPNVMQGYLRPDHPNALDPPPEGWFDTGDLAAFDADGYLTILGRLKRFVRVGAEMISLALVEAHAQRVWPHARHAAVAAPDEDRSEQIVLITDQADASLTPLVEWARANGVRLLELPQRIVIVGAVPEAPTGKLDYAAAERLAAASLAAHG